MKNPKFLSEVKQFVVRKTKCLPSWVFVLEVVVQEKCFVDQKSSWGQSFENVWEEGPMEIKEHDNHLETG